jgi:hypothetical protein
MKETTTPSNTESAPLGAYVKLLIVIWGVWALTFVALVVFGAYQSAVSAGKERVRELTLAAVAISDSYRNREMRGELTRTAAQGAALETIRSLMSWRSESYTFVYNIADGSGLVTPRAFKGVPIAPPKALPGRFTAYEHLRPGASVPETKISYVITYAPWGWSIGTGFYVEDVHREIVWLALGAILSALVLLTGLLTIGFSISRSLRITLGASPEELLSSIERMIRGDLVDPVPFTGSANIAARLEELRLETAQRIQDFDHSIARVEDSANYLQEKIGFVREATPTVRLIPGTRLTAQLRRAVAEAKSSVGRFETHRQ